MGGCLLLSTTIGRADLLNEAQSLFAPIPRYPQALEHNPTTTEKVELGKMLYFETRLSRAHNISCNTCHQIGRAGADGRSTSLGQDWQHGGRNAPTVLNSVFNAAQFWAGRAADLKEQAGGPIANPVEMGITPDEAVVQLKGIPSYVDAFDKAFPA